MTTLEFAKKCLSKAQKNLERAKIRPGVTKEELDALTEKLMHYKNIIYILEREDMR